MQAGQLDRRVTLQRASTAPNSFNEPESIWLPLATVWASKTDVSDGEKLRSAEVGATIDTRFQIRWSTRVSSIGPKDRLTFEGRTYDIVGVKEIGRRLGLEISATARNEVRP